MDNGNDERLRVEIWGHVVEAADMEERMVRQIAPH
jgi:hypothetical protein